MGIESLLSPDAVKNRAVEESAAALRELNNRIVNEVRITVKTGIDAQTYDATQDFQNSREKMDGDPIDYYQAKKYVAEGKRVIAMFEGLDAPQILAKMKETGFTMEDLETIKNKLWKSVKFFERNYNAENNEMYDKQTGHQRGSVEVARGDRDFFEALLNDSVKTSRGIYAIINKIKAYYKKLEAEKAQKALDEASKNGVSDYHEIPANSTLDSLVQRMKMEFKETIRYEKYTFIKVWINNEYTKFGIYPAQYDYQIFTTTEKNSEKPNAIVIKKISKKTGKTSYKKFVIDEENSRVLRFGRMPSQDHFEKGNITYPLPPKNPSNQKVAAKN